MNHAYTEPLADHMTAFFSSVERIADGGTYEMADVCHAMASLVGVEVVRARERPPREVIERFRAESAAALAPYAAHVRHYVWTIADEAEVDERGEDWPEVCTRRSAIEILLNEYAGTRATSAIDPADVARLDVELRRLGALAGPLPPGEVPPGLPASHWWWRHPAAV